MKGGLIAMLVVSLILVEVLVACNAGLTSPYRRSLAESDFLPLNSDVFAVPPGHNAPEQVHIIQGDRVGSAVIVSWTTPNEPSSSTVFYWKANTTNKLEAEGEWTQYTYSTYTSGFIHKATLSNLDFNTKYFYQVGAGNSKRTFWFVTPPPVGPDVPYTFGIIGDLSQTFASNNTLTHYENSPTPGQAVLYLGDMSYADKFPNHDNNRWDTWGRFIERSAAYQPWIWTVGNHEIDFAPELGETDQFKPFRNRFPTPYQSAGSIEPYWYSIKRGPAHIIVMSVYSQYNKYSPQFIWLKAELASVDRTQTPWLIVLMHPPTYCSYTDSFMEQETIRVLYEQSFVSAKVDMVFSGHVHAYERSIRVSNIQYNMTNNLCTPIKDLNAPVYLLVGDGGQSLSPVLIQPQPSYSAFREPSFGHGILDIRNRTHARFAWHRNQDAFAVESDSVWLTNRVWLPTDDSN